MGRPAARRCAPHRVALPLVGLGLVGALAGCGGGPRLSDLPADVASVKPDITSDQAEFVLTASTLGAQVSATTLDDDLETATTTCWALKNGGVSLRQLAVDDDDTALPNTGEALRTKRLMAAGVRAFCADYADQIPQLALP